MILLHRSIQHIMGFLTVMVVWLVREPPNFPSSIRGALLNEHGNHIECLGLEGFLVRRPVKSCHFRWWKSWKSSRIMGVREVSPVSVGGCLIKEPAVLNVASDVVRICTTNMNHQQIFTDFSEVLFLFILVEATWMIDYARWSVLKSLWT